MTKRRLEISFQRVCTFSKTIEVSEAIAERLLAMEDHLKLGTGGYTIGSNDDDLLNSDDFTMITEDLTSIHDVRDMEDEIDYLEVYEVKETEVKQ